MDLLAFFVFRFVQMADSIEANDKSDADRSRFIQNSIQNFHLYRSIDRDEFRKTQLDIFKHNFLESFDEAGYEKLEHLTLNSKLKKEVVNMARKLQKAKLSLQTISNEDRKPIEPVIAKIDEIFQQLIAFSKQSSEFSTSNIQLPEYNKVDMESLLGKNEADCEESIKESKSEVGMDPVKWLCQSNEEYERKITELLGAGELLMNEWHEIKNYIKDM